MFTKIIHGFVIQTFNDDGVCTEQAFIAGDIEYEDQDLIPLSGDDTPKYTYQPMDMQQP